MLVVQINGKSRGRWSRIWHWGIIAVSTVGVVTIAAAVRLIFHNARVYHFFADM